MSHQLKVGERVDENSIAWPAVGPKGLMVRRDADSVAHALAPWGEPLGFVGILDSRHFFVGRKIHHGESVRSVELCENPMSRTVGVTFDDYGEHSLVELNFPCDFHLLQIEDGNKLSGRGAGGRWNLPSAVNATSCNPRRTGMLLTFVRDLESMISSAPTSTASWLVFRMQTTISFPSLVTPASLAQPLRGTFLIIFPLFRSRTSRTFLAPAGDIEPASVRIE